MSDELILLAPLLVLLIFVVFGFTGCGGEPFESEPDDTTPPDDHEQPDIKYAEIVEATPGFTAHWPMNETGGATEALVNGPPNLNGVYMDGAMPGSPGAFASKDNGNFAPDLNGTTGYVEVPFSEFLNVQNGLPFSVEVWVKPVAAIPDGTEQIIISSHHISAGGNQRGYEIALIGTGAPDPTVRGRVFWTDAPFVTNVDLTPASGDPVAWRHVVLTHNGGGPAGNILTLYVSVEGVAGTQSTEVPNAEYREVQPGGAGERPLRFGAGHLEAGGPEKFFAGLIDEVAFYNLALGQTDVEQHFQAL
jgi:hypothetical protein